MQGNGNQNEVQLEGVVHVDQAAQPAPANAENPINAQHAQQVKSLIYNIILKANSNFFRKMATKMKRNRKKLYKWIK